MAEPLSPTPVPAPAEPDVNLGAALFLEQNFKKILLAALVLILGLAIWGVTAYMRHQTAREAGQQLTAAKTVEEYDLVVKNYSGSVAAGNALLLKAELLWKDDKKDASVQTLEQFLAEYPFHALKPSAQLALGSKQAVLGKKDEARKTFETFLNDSSDHPVAPAVHIQLADLLWAEGNVDEAKKILNGLPQKYAGKLATFEQEIQQRLLLLSAGLPTTEVDAPPAPAPAATPEIKLPSLTDPTLPSIGAPAPPAPTAPTPETPAAPAPPAPASPAPETPAAPAPPAPAAPTPETPAAPAPPAPASPTPEAPAAPAPGQN